MEQLFSKKQVDDFIRQHSLTLLMLKTQNCSVCEAVQPQAERLLEGYEHIVGGFVYMEDVPELAGEYMIFTSPVLLLLMEGKEVYRAARFIVFEELANQINRYHEFMQS
ncbi:thioredoxin family protein [Paenibacillus sp. KACC 21273]|uniref:thioredoxin family protein n=1 Tax=Paenibacillus sp. KACC 21273 TaxID=3025665 RepID=UPI002365E720|nr:thioredoxin family protein [Paenibacillus sp. KACC 21273]WDF50120.1 thioredoxin family protein [Paenibacillus sp. KACC 21273]